MFDAKWIFIKNNFYWNEIWISHVKHVSKAKVKADFELTIYIA